MPIQAADSKKRPPCAFELSPAVYINPYHSIFWLQPPGAPTCAGRMQPDVSYQVLEPGWGQDVSHSDPLLVVNSLGETGGADGGESASWMPFPLELSLHLRLARCQQGCNTDTVTARLATGSVPGSGGRLETSCCCWQHKQTQTRGASAEGPPPHPSIPPVGNNGEQKPFPHLHQTKQLVYWQLLPSQSLQKITPNKTNKQTGPVQLHFLWTTSIQTQGLTRANSLGHFSTAREPKQIPWVFCNSSWNWGQQSSEFR